MIPEPQLSQLYQEVILDHNAKPRNYRPLEGATQYSRGVNPFCGDDYHLFMVVDGEGVIRDVSFQGNGCAISKSSASLMTTLVKGRTVREAERLKSDFLSMMTTEAPGDRGRVGRLIIFEGVKAFPIRVKCATLIWHALEDAIKDAVQQAAPQGGVMSPMSEPDIFAEQTPNPQTLKFVVNRPLTEHGPYDYTAADQAGDSPLAGILLAISGVKSVMIGPDFVSVSKETSLEWEALTATIEEALKRFFRSGEPAVRERSEDRISLDDTGERIRRYLDAEIRPAVAQDGGDVVFFGFSEGVVRLKLRGACSSCPSATFTLKLGIENRLKQLFPEVQKVVAV
jgi:nitrogen fixation NifU-like protein